MERYHEMTTRNHKRCQATNTVEVSISRRLIDPGYFNWWQRESAFHLYQAPYVVTVSAHSRVAIDRMVWGAAVSLFQASQQASTTAV